MPSEPAKGKILVVDDSPLVLELVRETLSEAGYDVRTTSSWVEVNAALQRQRPDLILMDVQMPSIRGESFCRILKDSESWRDLPVVLFSSLDPSEIERLARESGADGWIPKRLRPDRLREDVEGVFRTLVHKEA